MYFGQIRLLKSAAVICGIFAALASLPSPLFAAEKEPPIIRTEADAKRGRQNVRSVVAELADLFADDAPEPMQALVKRKIEPPYSKVIQLGDGRAALIFRPRFSAAKQMFKTLDGVITSATLVESLEEQNEIIISANADEIEGYRKILEAMDIPSPQILIEAKVVEVMFNDGMERNLSMTFKGSRYNIGAKTAIPGNTSAGTSGAAGNFTPYAGANTMNVAFQWLETAQDATVLSSPNILLSRNEVSRIVTGEEIPIQEANSSGSTILMSTTFKNVGVTLEVEPSMINLDNVTLRIYPKVSNVLRYDTVSSGDTSYSVPVISARSVETHLRMQDKQVVMMGGLYSNRTALQQERIPIISDIPFIGEIFTGKNETKEITQLIFFLKIHIIPPDRVASGILYDFDRNAKVSETLSQIVTNSDSFPTHVSSSKKFHDEVVAALPGKKDTEREHFKEKPILIKSADEEKIKNVSAIDSDLFVLEPNQPNPPPPEEKKTPAPRTGNPSVKVTVVPNKASGE